MEYEIFNPTCALPYDIVRRIRQVFVNSDDVNDGKDSFYISLGMVGARKCEIRVSNHCTHLWTWHERRNGKFDDITRISIVFEETDTYSDGNLELRKPRPTPLRVEEFVYRISKPDEFTTQDVTMVIKAIKNAIRSGTFQDPTGKMSYSKKRVSVNPKSSGRWNENKNNQINSNKNMNKNRKNVVKLTESKLRDMIKESVNEILNEGLFDGVKQAAAQFGNNGNNSMRASNALQQAKNDYGKIKQYQQQNGINNQNQNALNQVFQLWNQLGQALKGLQGQ